MKRIFERLSIKNGEYPNKKYINQLIADIDTRLSIFQYEDVSADSKFNTRKFNEDMAYIHEDLKILYSIVDNIAHEKYIALESYINGYLTAIENKADYADKLAAYAIDSSAINSKVIYFSDHCPSIKVDKDKIIVALGAVQVTPKTKVSAYVNGTGFYQDSTSFVFDNEKTIAPYLVDHDEYFVEGDTTTNTYHYSSSSMEAKNRTVYLPISGFTPDERYKYTVFSGKNKINCTSLRAHVLRNNSGDIIMNETTTVSFYIKDAKNIDIEVSRTPVYKNFSEYTLKNLPDSNLQYYEMSLERGTAISIETDGTLYACKEDVGINTSSNKLYIKNATIATDFDVFEELPAEQITKNVVIYFYNVDINAFHIDSIALKETSITEVPS